ncbi:MAG: hypothetical protein RR998_06405 [Oscillospiraceae bacterium]
MTKKKKNRDFAEVFAGLLGERLSDAEIADIEQGAKGADSPGEETRDEAIAMAVIRKALRGDLSAAKYVAEAAAKSVPDSSNRPFRLTLVIRRPNDET